MIRLASPQFAFADLEYPLPAWPAGAGAPTSTTDIVRAAVGLLSRIPSSQYRFAGFQDGGGLFIRATSPAGHVDFYLQDPADAPNWQAVYFDGRGRFVDFIPFPWRGLWDGTGPLLSERGLFDSIVMSLADLARDRRPKFSQS